MSSRRVAFLNRAAFFAGITMLLLALAFALTRPRPKSIVFRKFALIDMPYYGFENTPGVVLEWVPQKRWSNRWLTYSDLGTWTFLQREVSAGVWEDVPMPQLGLGKKPGLLVVGRTPETFDMYLAVPTNCANSRWRLRREEQFEIHVALPVRKKTIPLWKRRVAHVWNSWETNGVTEAAP